MTEENKEAIVALLNTAWQSRTFKSIEDETSLSYNMIYRLRRGQFSQPPSEEVIHKITRNKPNGVCFEDFLPYIYGDRRIKPEKIDAESLSLLANSIIINYLFAGNSINEIRVINTSRDDHKRYDFETIIMQDEEQKHIFFDYKFYGNSNVSHQIIESVFCEIAMMSLKQDEELILCTDNQNLYSNISQMIPNLKNKCKVMLLDFKALKVKSITDSL